MSDKEKKQGTSISRRSFLKGVGTGTVAATVVPSVLIGSENAAEAPSRRRYFYRDHSTQHQRRNV